MLRVQTQNKLVSQGFTDDWHHPIYQTLTQKDPCDPRNVICEPYLLSLICIPMQAKLNKRPFSSERLVSLIPQADHVLVELFSSMVAWESSAGGVPPQYPKNPETPNQKNLYIPMFIAAQFTIAKRWKQPSAHQQMSG